MAFLSRRRFLTTMTGVSTSGMFAGRCHGFLAESPASPAAEPPQSDCQRWMWIELIGFDNQKADLGVADFLDNAGFVPDGLSLLFASADFVHTHQGLDREVVFPPDYCSYSGKPYNMERKRQAWTNRQLKGLVDRLRQRGIQVYFTLFNLYPAFTGELFLGSANVATRERQFLCTRFSC